MPKRNKSYWMMMLVACTVVSAVMPLGAAAEGGDSIATAPLLTPGVNVTGDGNYGSSSPDRRRFWRISLNAGDTLTVNFSLVRGGGPDVLNLCLLDPSVTDYTEDKSDCAAYEYTHNKTQLKYKAPTSGLWTLEMWNCYIFCNAERWVYELTAYVTGPTPPPSPPIKPLPKPLPATGPALVAVGGDSYAAGLGTQRFPVNGSGCHRTDQGWPNLMPFPVVSVACSGAHISSLYDSFQGQSPQIAHIKRVKPDAVVMVIGGNDAGFSTALRNCYNYNCAGGKLNQNGVAIAGMHSKLAPGYAAIARGLPDAKVFVPLYPTIFPAYPAAIVNCGWLTNSERLMLNRMAIALNTEIKLAVAQANATIGGKRRIHLVSGTQGALAGHELCSGASSWVFKLTPACLKDLRCGHPTAPGQEALATVIASAIQSKY